MSTGLADPFRFMTSYREPASVASEGTLRLFEVSGYVRVAGMFGVVTTGVTASKSFRLVASSSLERNPLSAITTIDARDPEIIFGLGSTSGSSISISAQRAGHDNVDFDHLRVLNNSVIELEVTGTGAGSVSWGLVWNAISPGAMVTPL